jgi:hypothetical protein
MIADAGFVVEGAGEAAPPRNWSSGHAEREAQRRLAPTVRWRGPGTDLPANF